MKGLRVVLVSPRNPLNIGAAARAMSNFGFTDMALVNPYDLAFREAQSAVNADHVMQAATVHETVAAAVADCQLVVGTTGDPATPLASSQNMADALEEGVLLTVTADQHTGYGVNQCSYDVIDGYLVDLTVPAVGTVC